MTAEIADGWQPIHFVPDRFERVWGDALRAGAAKRSAELAPLDIFGDAQLAIGEGADVAEAREAARNTIGFYVGGMGAKSKNYYNDLFRRYGWEDEAEKIQDLFLSGKRAEAMAAVPDEYLDTANLIGTEGHIKERLGVYAGVGVTHLIVNPTGTKPLDDLSAVKALDRLRGRHEDRRRPLPDRRDDEPGRVRHHRRSARLRVDLVPGALAHPDQPPVTVGWPARARRRCRTTTPAPTTRSLPSAPARRRRRRSGWPPGSAWSPSVTRSTPPRRSPASTACPAGG